MSNITQEILDDAIKVIKDWFELILPADIVIEFIKESNETCFDTVGREDLIDFVAKKVTGMSWPMFGDNKEYKTKFFNKLNENISKYNIAKC